MSKAKWREIKAVAEAMDNARFVHFRSRRRNNEIVASAAVIKAPTGEFVFGLGQVNKADGDTGSRKAGREVSLGRAGKTLAALLGAGTEPVGELFLKEEDLINHIRRLKKRYASKR